ncbi:MAG: hypothetical protein R3B99_35235 [Polyangiales bacterium]
MTAPAMATVTFVHEGAGDRNSLGYFTWSTTVGPSPCTTRSSRFRTRRTAARSGGTLVAGDRALRDLAGNLRVCA